jgi:hypothetical protein
VTGRARRLLLAVVALAVAWVAAPGAVPLYDGISVPDEPYRYVAPPAGYRHTAAPLSAKASVAVSDGTNATTLYVNTDEQAPQVAVVIPGRLVTVPAAARSLTVAAVPLAPDRQPAKGTIDGNVYRVSASAGASFAPPPGDAASLSQVTMRATTARRPIPTFLYRASAAAAWQPVKTFVAGNDIYTTQFAGFGDYALAFGVTAAAGSGVGVGTGVLVASALLAVVLLAAGVVVAVRLSRRHHEGASPP